MYGTEVLTKIRQSGKDVDILMVTAANDTATISTSFRAGIIGYIIKPFKFKRYQIILESFREMKLKLQNKSSMSQCELDHLMLGKKQKDVPLSKNLHKSTLTSILEFLYQADHALSAEEVAAGTGLSRPTTRRYLEYLSEIGQLEILPEYLLIGDQLTVIALKREEVI